MAAGAMARVMTDLLYGVEPTDLPTLVVVTAALATIAILGCVIPGLKAAMVDPVTALRAD
jgi:hypothetical protein